MRILLTNDDGLHAAGIVALHAALSGGDPAFPEPLLDNRDTTLRSPRSVVYPVAPKTVQSASSHGITFHDPLMVDEERVNERMQGIAVDGRPADCVKLALTELWPARFGAGSLPDLVLSGINMGANAGIHVIYSGTVAAALEAAFLGVPAIALSLYLGRGRARYDVAARHARAILERVLAEGLLRPHECLNINLPITEADGPVPQLRVCPMNTHGADDSFEKRESPRGGSYYWMMSKGLAFLRVEPESDVDLLYRGFATVTPLSYDLTRHAEVARWRTRLGAG